VKAKRFAVKIRVDMAMPVRNIQLVFIRSTSLRDIAYFDVGSECRQKGINNMHTSDRHSLAELHAIKYRRSDLRPKGLSSAVDVEREKALSGVGLAHGGVGRAGRTTCQNWKRCILNLSMGVKEGSQTTRYLGLMYTGCLYIVVRYRTAARQ
jgi:hypothetical protein